MYRIGLFLANNDFLTSNFYLLSHKNMESFDECSTNDTIVEDMETELCFNEESSNTQGADVTHTLKSGWPACQGKLTFTNSNSEEKVYVA